MLKTSTPVRKQSIAELLVCPSSQGRGGINIGCRVGRSINPPIQIGELAVYHDDKGKCLSQTFGREAGNRGVTRKKDEEEAGEEL